MKQNIICMYTFTSLLMPTDNKASEHRDLGLGLLTCAWVSMAGGPSEKPCAMQIFNRSALLCSYYLLRVKDRVVPTVLMPSPRLRERCKVDKPSPEILRKRRGIFF